MLEVVLYNVVRSVHKRHVSCIGFGRSAVEQHAYSYAMRCLKDVIARSKVMTQIEVFRTVLS